MDNLGTSPSLSLPPYIFSLSLIRLKPDSVAQALDLLMFRYKPTIPHTMYNLPNHKAETVSNLLFRDLPKYVFQYPIYLSPSLPFFLLSYPRSPPLPLSLTFLANHLI